MIPHNSEINSIKLPGDHLQKGLKVKVATPCLLAEEEAGFLEPQDGQPHTE